MFLASILYVLKDAEICFFLYRLALILLVAIQCLLRCFQLSPTIVAMLIHSKDILKWEIYGFIRRIRQLFTYASNYIFHFFKNFYLFPQ